MVAAVGLPLPLFFQWDDIEYGLRAARGRVPHRHPAQRRRVARRLPLEGPRRVHRYFSVRNALITAALHSGFDGKPVAKGLLAQLGRYLLSMQYGLAYTLIKAVEDFCAGPQILDDGGSAAAGEIRRERAAYAETVLHPASAMPGLRPADAPLAASSGPPSLKLAVLGKRLIGQASGVPIAGR